MATFVLYPPPELRARVRIVSFFITARLAAQDTREAFTTALMHQAGRSAGQDPPPRWTRPTEKRGYWNC